MYLKKFCIPSGTKIKQKIWNLFQGSKKGDDNDNADEMNSDEVGKLFWNNWSEITMT